MPTARCNDVDLCYETFGHPEGRPLVLIMGLGRQLIHWPVPLCEGLADRGHYVVRFDNRDMGASTSFEAAGLPSFSALRQALQGGEPPPVAYTLRDLARDTVGLMDVLGMSRAHLLGVSLGGMVAQWVAIDHPARVATLTSLMSTTHRPGLPGPSEAGAKLLRQQAPTELEAFLDHSVARDRILNGSHFPFDPALSRERAAQALARGYSPNAPARQLAAAMASGPRHELLPKVQVPALVVHGEADPLIDIACGRDTAECLPNARFVAVPELGHSLPEPIWGMLIEETSRLTGDLESARR